MPRQWRLVPRRARLWAQALVVVLLSGTAFSVLLRRADIDSTAASLLVGVALAAIGFLQTRQVERRQRTVELIAALQSSDTLSAADCWMAARISSGVPVGDDIKREDDQFVITLLDYYEFLCILADRGHLDGALLADLRGAAMARALSVCATYVAVRRARVGDELYRRYDCFVRTRCQQVRRAGERVG